MASRYIYQRDPGADFYESDTESIADDLDDFTISDHGRAADNIPLLLDEVRENYNVNSADGIQSMSEENPTETETQAAFEEALNSLNDANVDRSKSCASCSKEERVENVSSFRRGKHISMPGQYGRFYNKITRKLKHPYRHHAIIKEIRQTAGTRVEMVLIHFSKENGRIKIYEAVKTYDLKHDEIYIIQYIHPRYSADEIVSRAELMLPANGEHQEFRTYDVGTRNCEHFATWCVVGEGESIQVQGIRQSIADGFRKLFGDGSRIAKGIIRLLYVSSDEIAASLTKAVNVPEIVLGGTAAIYLVYCIVMTALHIRDYKKGQLCWSCLKGKLQDLWLTFGVFGVSSVITFVIFHFALPLMAPAVGIPLVIILILLSVVLQWSVPRIRKALQNPFTVDKTAVKALSELNIGEVISLRYYGLEHLMIVSEVHEDTDESTKGRIRGIHYGLPSLLGTREIMEEYFPVDVARKTVRLYDCCHLLCHPRESVVTRARKRVGEKKWDMASNRSDHFCYWAKVQQRPSGVCEEWNNGDLKESDCKTLSSLFIEKKEIHLISDIKVGDVIQFKDIGVLVKKGHSHDRNGRRFQIEMMVYDRRWHCRCMKYDVDLDQDRLFVKKYHPAQCHPMAVRAERAKQLRDQKGQWWTDQGFIEHCIMLNP